MAALARVSSDVIAEILPFLDVESVVQVGAASTSLRTAALLDRVWTPRLATCGLGRFAVDAGALAELSTIKVDARRLCLQCLPWRPRRGTGPAAASTWQSSWSWRPSQMPERLHQPNSSGDWIFVEVYERGNIYQPGDTSDKNAEHLRVTFPGVRDDNYIDIVTRAIAHKFVRVEDCTFDDFPDRISVPLNVVLLPQEEEHGEDNFLEWEVRVLVQLGGILVPFADTCCMQIADEDRYHVTKQSALIDVGQDLTVSVEKYLEQGRLHSIDLVWSIGKQLDDDDFRTFVGGGSGGGGYQVLENDVLGAGEQGLRAFHNDATRVISTIEDGDTWHLSNYRYSFACDYERHPNSRDGPNSNLFDFTRKKGPALLPARRLAVRAAD